MTRHAIGRALADAARTVAELWRPMTLWAMLVWAAGLTVLSPLTAFVLGRLLGADGVISNDEVVSWLLTPAGAIFVLIWLASALTLSVMQFGGAFRLVAYQRARTATVSRAAMALTTGLPAVFRFCATAVAAAIALLAPLAAWLGFLYATFLQEHDINYYLSARPPEFRYALALATPVALAWIGAALWLIVRTAPMLPAFFDGHRPLRRAVVVGWQVSRHRAGTLLARFAAAVGIVAVVRGILAGTMFGLAAAVTGDMASTSTSLRPLLITTAAFTVAAGALDVIISFLGASWLSVILTRFYLESAAGGPRREPPVGAVTAAAWLTGPRAALVVAGALAINLGATLTTLEGVSNPPDVLVIAHRAGAYAAPENTLLALDRAIAARAEAAEIDVQRTRDGTVVVIHDADLMRVARDPRTIAGTDYAAFAGVRQGDDDGAPADERKLARLDEFLDRSKGRINLLVELKYYGWDPLLAPEVLSLIRARGMDRQTMIISLSLQAIEQVRALSPEMSTGYLSSVSIGPLEQLPVTALALSRQRATAPVIRTAHARGHLVYVWTLNDAGGMIEMIGRGADGIITDDPALGARVRNELRALTSTEFLLLRFSDALTDEEANDDALTVQ